MILHTNQALRLQRKNPMPSKSAKQHRFMLAAAHNPKFAKKAGIPQSVAEEFVAADKRKAHRGTEELTKKKR